MGLLKIEAL